MRRKRALIGAGGFESEMFQDRRRRCRIKREPGPHGRARGIVNLVDQARCEFDELPGFLLAMGVGLNIEVGEHAEQRRTDIDALSTREVNQAVKTGEQRSFGHLRYATDFSKSRLSLDQLL